MKLPIYLDYAATCPVDERVAKKMMEYLTIDGVFGNPASRSHKFGWQAEEAVDIARNQIADLIGADHVKLCLLQVQQKQIILQLKVRRTFIKQKVNTLLLVKLSIKPYWILVVS